MQIYRKWIHFTKFTSCIHCIWHIFSLTHHQIQIFLLVITIFNSNIRHDTPLALYFQWWVSCSIADNWKNVPLSKTDSVLVQRHLLAHIRPPLQVEAAAELFQRWSAQWTGPPLPLFPLPPLPRTSFLLPLADGLHRALLVCLRLVGFLREVGTLLVLQTEADWQVLGAPGGFRMGGACSYGDAHTHRHGDGEAASPSSAAADTDAASRLLSLADLGRVNFMQQFLQPHASLKILQRPALVVHQLSVCHRTLPGRERNDRELALVATQKHCFRLMSPSFYF